jgi:hypothetical protein
MGANPNMLETFVRAALTEGDNEDGLAARSVHTLVPLTADALRDVDPGYRRRAHDHRALHTFCDDVRRASHLPIGEVYPQLEHTVRRSHSTRHGGPPAEGLGVASPGQPAPPYLTE